MAKTGRSGRFVKRPHDDASYRQRRKQLMESITPRTRCGRCGLLFHQHPPHKNGKVGRWEVGHVLDAVTHGNRGPLRIEHSVCNRKAGGKVGYARGLGRQAASNGGSAGMSPIGNTRPIGPHHPVHYNLDDPESVGAPPCVLYGGKLCQTCADWRARNP